MTESELANNSADNW